MQATVKFNSEVFNKNFEDGTTISDILSNYDLKVVAGWGDNVRALIAGVEQPSGALVPNGATIVVETRANSKAKRRAVAVIQTKAV